MRKTYCLRCISCDARFPADDIIYTCPDCGGLLEVSFELSRVDARRLKRPGPLSVHKYSELLPLEKEPVTLDEGGTPLYRGAAFESELNLPDIRIKHEGLNPSGSFKDRGMTVGVSKALELGMRMIACASTGNTSASMAMYGARAGLPSIVLLPSGKVALGKLAQAMIFGAKILLVKGNFDQSLDMVQQLCRLEDIYLLNSINPYRLEGQKTIAFEVAEKLGWKVPDRLVLPLGNAGNISAIYKGFCELSELGLTDGVPRMTAVQAAGAAPVVEAFSRHRDDIEPWTQPETMATAIRIGNPVNARKALRAIYESDGCAVSVNEDEIVRAQRDLAARAGIGVEPASATSLAGLRRLVDDGEVDAGERVVCVTTGNLLKDPEAVVRASARPVEVEASMDSLRAALKEIGV